MAVASLSMHVLPPRTYASGGKPAWLRYGGGHPAKMHPELARDLFLRYTLPGMTVLDPFLGRGTSLIGCALGRNLLGVELEAPFAQAARDNYRYLRAHSLPGVPLGWARVFRGDSRRLPFRSAADAVVTSPPYADTPLDPGESSRPEAKIARLLAEGKYREAEVVRLHGSGKRSIFRSTGYGSSAGQIGDLPLGDVAAAIASPPYGDVASRDRSKESYCQAQDPLLRAKYGTGDTNRHIDGYGETPGQIGNLPHAAIGSPPYGNVFSDWDATSNAAREGQTVLYSDERWSGARQNIGNIPYYDHEHSSKRSPKAPDGAETYADACLEVYRECYRVVRPGGVLVLVTGNYVRTGAVVDLAADTIALARAAGWTPWERWEHRKSTVSFWRRLHNQQGRPVVVSEDVLVFVKGSAPAWAFADLAPTYRAPADLTPRAPAPISPTLFDYAEGAAS